MENTKKKSIIWVVVLVIAILLLAGLLLWNSLSKDNSTTVSVEYENDRLSMFNENFSKELDYVKNSNMTGEEGSYYLNSWLNDNASTYNSKSVDLVSFELSSMLGGSFDSVTGLVDTVGSKLESFDVSNLLGGLLGGDNSEATRVITMRSNTACQSVSDSKYCVNKLSANVYVSNVNSNKWVVLVHPFMTSGALIYNAIGGMYEEQGYNVLAPDLRGFGNSDGSVAMGYLESLDIYDWIKDLNTNWSNSNRYGVNVAPTTIVVHGISLGGATTLQLATNPDIAAANGQEPYTKTLSQLNVKGFVDDCGYTSMSGIITGMLGSGSTVDLSSLFSSLNIDEVDFMSELQNVLDQYGVSGFDFDLDSLTGNKNIVEKYKMYKEFSKQYSYLEDALSGDLSSSVVDKVNPYFNGQYDLGNVDLGKIKDKYGSYYEVPSVDNYKDYLNSAKDYFDNAKDSLNDSNDYLDQYKDKVDEYKDKVTDQFGSWFSSNSADNNAVVKPMNNNLLSGNGDFLDGIVGTALMNLVGVGLTEDNYAKYSDVFSEGRRFPVGSKVVIIHGTADTTVPTSNADTVANNVAPATLIKRWNVSGAPHAFVVIGTKTNEYSNVVANLTSCVENASCTSIN